MLTRSESPNVKGSYSALLFFDLYPKFKNIKTIQA
jgi:hypothetical protein